MTEEEEKPLEGLTDEEKCNIIANAVKEIDLQDILVCGQCHEVFHFVEEFKEHKENETCEGNGEIKETLKDDKKPQIWAFTLWKNTKFKKVVEEDKPKTSWNVYQTWRAMKPHEKQAWITVASNMQSLFEIVANYERSKLKLIPKKEESEEKEEDEEEKKAMLAKKIVRTNTRKAIRSGSEPKVEHLVEKIISKRYNPRRRSFEYLIKWENLDSEKNSWEPTGAMNNCKNMVDEFEKNLQIQKEQTKNQKIQDKKNKNKIKPVFPEGRPQRTSKQKALNQVKAWCGAEADDPLGKRVFSDDSEEDESYDKRMKMEDDTSDSDDNTPVVTIKRVTKNGVEKKAGSAHMVDSITLPENILIPDAKGIVRISQKQIPSLSSGVYVMSKTAGIIKLDNAAAAKLTQGGGQTVLKVAPKVGTTTVKVIKRDMSNGASGKTIMSKTILTQTQKPANLKNYSGKVYMQKRTNAQAAASAAALQNAKKDLDMSADMDFDDDDDEESDGIEELEFPDEITLPTADSPPPEITLCPLTGNVIDKDGAVIEAPEPEPESDTPPTPNLKSAIIRPTVTTPSNSLGNLVNIAAADILDDLTNNDIKEEPMTINESDLITSDIITSTQSTTVTTISSTSTPLTITTQTSMKPNNTTKTNPTSILSTALTNANIVRRGPPKLVPRSQPRPGILQGRSTQPQPVRGPTQAVITRIAPGGTQVRRPGTQIIRKRIVHQVPCSYNPQTGQRTVVRQRVYHQVAKSTPQVTTYVATPTTTNKIISMPPLIESKPVTVPIIEKPQQKVITQVAPSVVQASPVEEIVQPSTSATVQEANTINLGDTDTPLLITGEDGTIYQVAGQNEDGQTILITQGEDGEQQCLLVAPENASLINQALMKPQQVQMEEPVVQPAQIIQEEPQTLEQPLTINTAVEHAVEEPTDDSQVVAQIISANPPSPGGTRKVVLMLPDGSFMMTEVTADQYAALELDK